MDTNCLTVSGIPDLVPFVRAGLTLIRELVGLKALLLRKVLETNGCCGI